MSDETKAKEFFVRYGLEDVSRVSDPQRALYRAFNLRRGGVKEIFGLKVWRRGVEALLAGHVQGRLQGDGFQLPGVFLVAGGKLIREFRHETVADRPNYEALASCESSACEID